MDGDILTISEDNLQKIFRRKRVQPSNSDWAEAPFGGVRDVSIIIYFFFVLIFLEHFLFCGVTIHIYIYWGFFQRLDEST